MTIKNLLSRLFGNASPAGTVATESKSSEVTTNAVMASVNPEQIEAEFYEVLFDSPIQESSLSLPQRLVVDVVKARLSDPDQRFRAVPQLPSVIPRLLRSLRDPEASIKDYVAIVDKDPNLSASVLRLANSAYFNRSQIRISSIERAVVKLGVDGLRSVLSAAVMQPILQRNSPYFQNFGLKLWRHSLCCAVACEVLAKDRGLEPFKVYMLGLAHDIGKTTVFSELCKEFKLNTADDRPGCQVFVPLISEFSAQLSAWIGRDWDLPMDLCSALDQQVGQVDAEGMEPYAKLLFQANLACEFYASGGHEKQREADNVCSALNLPTNLFKSLDTIAVEI
mgnify:CR=1 FL=1